MTIIGCVVRDTEAATAAAELPEEEGALCVIPHMRRLRAMLGEAVEAFYGVLDRYTLADLVHKRPSLAAVLFVRRALPVLPPRKAS